VTGTNQQRLSVISRVLARFADFAAGISDGPHLDKDMTQLYLLFE
jgi:hypothetical protein